MSPSDLGYGSGVGGGDGGKRGMSEELGYSKCHISSNAHCKKPPNSFPQ